MYLLVRTFYNDETRLYEPDKDLIIARSHDYTVLNVVAQLLTRYANRAGDEWDVRSMEG